MDSYRKKNITLILLVALSIFLMSCTPISPKETNDNVVFNDTLITSLGNQNNNWRGPRNIIGDNGWIYISVSNNIVKANIDNPNNFITILKDESIKSEPRHINVYNGWVYYITDLKEGNNLLRTQEDGSKTEKLSSNVSNYILTKDKIYFDTLSNTEPGTVNKMDHDGRNEEIIINKDYALEGLDNNWIYYNEYPLDGFDCYRMTFDGEKKEHIWELFDINYEEVNDFLIDDNSIIYTKKSILKYSLIIKEVGKKEIVLDKDDYFDCINIEDNYLFYTNGSAVYKINIKDKNKKQLIYKIDSKNEPKTHITSIYLKNGDALITKNNGSTYVKKDGTTLEL